MNITLGDILGYTVRTPNGLGTLAEVVGDRAVVLHESDGQTSWGHYRLDDVAVSLAEIEQNQLQNLCSA